MAIFLKNNIGHWKSILFCFLLSDPVFVGDFPRSSWLSQIKISSAWRLGPYGWLWILKIRKYVGPSRGRSILPKPFPSHFPGKKKNKEAVFNAFKVFVLHADAFHDPVFGVDSGWEGVWIAHWQANLDTFINRDQDLLAEAPTRRSCNDLANGQWSQGQYIVLRARSGRNKPV